MRIGSTTFLISLFLACPLLLRAQVSADRAPGALARHGATHATALLRGQGAADRATPPAVDPLTGIVHSQRLESGAPLGGIGTGTVQVMTDGTVSHATINNNWNQPTGDLPGCFAALWTRAGSQTNARVLALNSPYKLPTAPKLDFDGLFPQATMEFPDSTLPIQVSLRAFSPLIPGDLRNSSFPAAAFVFRLVNASPAPVEISVALAWENTLGVGENADRQPVQDRDGDKVTPIPDADGFFALRFTGPPPGPGPVSDPFLDNRSGEMTLMAYPPRRTAVVTTAGWNALDPRPGWWEEFARDGSVSGAAPVGQEGVQSPAGVVAVQMTLKPHDSVEIPVGIAWYTPTLKTANNEDYGHYYQIAFPDSYHAIRSLLADWRSLLALTQEWQSRLLFSNLPVSIARSLINSATPLTTNTIHTRDGRFTFLPEVGPFLPSEKFSYLRQRLRVSALLAAFFPELDAQELADLETAQSPEGAFPADPADWAHRLGPAIRPKADLEGANGLSDLGGPDERHLLAQPATPGPQPVPPAAIDSASAFTLQALQYVQGTGDIAFLYRVMPGVRLAMSAFLQRADPDGFPVPSGLQPAQAATAYTPSELISWMAALRAAERLAKLAQSEVLTYAQRDDFLGAAPGAMAEIEIERTFADACEAAYAQAANALEKHDWNGQFYTQSAPASSTQAAPLERLYAADPLEGQWAADALELGPLVSADRLTTALKSLQALFWQEKAFPYGPPQRLGQQGTLPADDAAASDCLLATAVLDNAILSITERQPEAGFKLLQRLQVTLIEELRSPWQAAPSFGADTGQTAAKGAADLAQAAYWNALNALEGFTYDLNAGKMALSVQIPGTWRTLSAPVFSPTFWGRLEFKPTAHGGLLTLRLDRVLAVSPKRMPRKGAGGISRTLVVLRQLRTPGPPARANQTPLPLPTVHVSLGPNPIGCHVVREPSGDLTLTFDTPLSLVSGDLLEVDVH